MTKKETLALMKAIKDYYPRFYENADQSAAAVLWHEALEGENYEATRKALIEFIQSDEKGYPPMAGQLISIMRPKRSSEEFVW